MVRRNRAVRTTARRPGMMSRLRARAGGRRSPITETTTTTTTTRRANGVATTRHSGGGGLLGGSSRHHHHNGGLAAAPVRRRASLGDKVSGALMKLRGSLTRRPGLKAAGTRRMHGTDGRGSHRVY